MGAGSRWIREGGKGPWGVGVRETKVGPEGGCSEKGRQRGGRRGGPQEPREDVTFSPLFTSEVLPAAVRRPLGLAEAGSVEKFEELSELGGAVTFFASFLTSLTRNVGHLKG